jgi:uncharacterized protein YcsI (UPF0317 family)
MKNKNLVIELESDATKSRVYYKGKIMEEVEKVEVIGTPDYTHIILHCIEGKVIADDYSLKTTSLKKKKG